MKKIKISVCLLLIVLTLAGCGGSETDTTTQMLMNTTQTAVTTTESTVVSTQPSAQETTEKLTTTEAVEVTTTKPITTETTEKETTTVASTTATTSPATTTQPSQTIVAEPKETCIITIEYKSIKDNTDKLKKTKKSFVTESGVVLQGAVVEIKEGETAFDILKRACKENVCTDNCKYCKKSGIQLEYNHSAAFDTYYVEGIHQIYEKDCGTMSGWMYSVNGEYPNVGSSAYVVSPGDKIVFSFTCNMGEDVGNTF